MSLLLDYVTEEAVRKGTIVRLTVEDFRPELWKQLLYHKDKWISQPIRKVINHLVKVRL